MYAYTKKIKNKQQMEDSRENSDNKIKNIKPNKTKTKTNNKVTKILVIKKSHNLFVVHVQSEFKSICTNNNDSTSR